MIFNKDYDKMLWLILKNDKGNRERILEFIKSIPSDFLVKIQDTIKEYEEYKLSDDKHLKMRNFNGKFYDGEKYLYHFSIDKDRDTLFVGRNAFKYGKIFNDFGLLLFNGSNVNQINTFDEYVIGNISFDYELINDGMRIVQGKYTFIDYKLLDVMLGKVIVTSNRDWIMFKNRMVFVDINNVPDNYNLGDVNILVRKRIFGKEKNDI